jgi:phosphotransferase system enzyme I (PtsI)
VIILKGKGVVQGISFGELRIQKTQGSRCAEKYLIDDVDAEIEKYEVGKKKAVKHLQKLYEKVAVDADDDSAMIFEVHKMMIEDESYCDGIINLIRREKVNCEYAAHEVAREIIEKIAGVEDEYIGQRAADVKDVSKLLIDCICGRSLDHCKIDSDSILGADDFTPSQTAKLDKKKTKGLLMMNGATASHACILARAMNIPSIVGLGDQLKYEYDGSTVILDGFSGTVYINPDITTMRRMSKKHKLCRKHDELLNRLKGKENITLDGQKIKLYANIGSTHDLEFVEENDAGGIGLYRSEFLYLKRKDYPTEESQYRAYKKVLKKMGNKEVTIRTLDIGADKKVDYFKLPKENNPAMGYRAIRICLDRPPIFKQQLRAIYKASVFGNVSIMFPMIISVEEFRRAKKITQEVKDELLEAKTPFKKDVKMGVMIETPAAVFTSDELAKEADFFSIGTNDLTQYTLAVDRQNNKISDMYDPYHKSILRMIKMVADNAHKNNIEVGICGELAADEKLTELFLALGIDKLSMSSPFVLGVRKKVLEADIGRDREEIFSKFL